VDELLLALLLFEMALVQRVQLLVVLERPERGEVLGVLGLNIADLILQIEELVSDIVAVEVLPLDALQ